MTKITNTQRTILRSRVRRHIDLAAHIPAGKTVADLSNADLVQVAFLLDLEIPSLTVAKQYDEIREAGRSASDAMALLDRADQGAGTGGKGMARISMTTATGGTTSTLHAPDDDKPSVDPTDDEPTTPAETPAPAEPDEAQVLEAKAKQAVADLQGLFALQNFQAYQAGLMDLARRAVAPPQVITQTVHVHAPIDGSKIAGQIPVQTGIKSAASAGMVSAFGINAGKVSLPVYDAVDAPRVDGDYIWPDAATAAMAQLARGRAVFLWGPASTGKTSFAKQVAAQWQRPYVRISCTETTEAETLVGMTVPDATSGGVKWQDGQLTKAIRKPGTVVHIDEVTAARPGALFVLQSVMDEERSIHIAETGEVVPIAPGVVIILSDNTNGTGDASGQYEATRVMNRAFLDRSGVTIKLDYMDQVLEAKALASRTKCKPELAAMLTRFAKLTRTKADAGDVSHGLTMRRLIALAELITDGVQPDTAFQMAVIETAPHDDREPLRQLWTADVDASRLVKAAN